MFHSINSSGYYFYEFVYEELFFKRFHIFVFIFLFGVS